MRSETHNAFIANTLRQLADEQPTIMFVFRQSNCHI